MRKRLITLLVCAMLLMTQPVTAHAAEETGGLFAGKFKAGSQIFDVQRTYNETEATVRSFARPYYSNTNSDQFLETDDDALRNKYFRFKDEQSTVTISGHEYPLVGLYLYNDADDSLATIPGKVGADGLVSQGGVVFIADEGFLYISEKNYGYFIANAAGYQYGNFSGTAPLYLRSHPKKDPTLKDLVNYQASNVPMASGNVLLRFYENGDNVTNMPAAVTIPASTNYTIAASLNPTRSGHVFNEWNTKADGSGTSYIPDAVYNSNVGANLYAQWTAQPPSPPDSSKCVITKGQHGQWTGDSMDGLGFTSNGLFNTFTGVLVDEHELSDDQYTAQSGSTIVTLKASYLKTLSVGKHTLTINFTDEYAETDFTILAAEADVPATGDGEQPMLWFGLMLMAIALLILSTVLRRRRQNG